ncbi:hypothetical protein BP00DRAFT_39160 [Aspergillus indologenus CBS 114.80]|uniref:Secreted protein n=1 Tax=Aspergillus indologenus CBS 114.80 TaxID=1450541 RepID=A0A2V5IZP1_9EURO|nr:hypothetical protein BP00DRAFT_39160 [Aspergillus indologenus CBS 114.80]
MSSMLCHILIFFFGMVLQDMLYMTLEVALTLKCHAGKDREPQIQGGTNAWTVRHSQPTQMCFTSLGCWRRAPCFYCIHICTLYICTCTTVQTELQNMLAC